MSFFIIVFFVERYGILGLINQMKVGIGFIGFIVLKRDTLRSTALMGTISIVLAFLFNIVIPFHFG